MTTQPENEAKRPASRAGKKAVTLYLDPDIHTELEIAAKRRKGTLQSVAEIAMVDWLRANINKGIPAKLLERGEAV